MCKGVCSRVRSRAIDLSLVHARSSALWVARAACEYPPWEGGGSMCVICIGVSLRVRPLRETSKRSIRLESFGNARIRKGDLFKAHSAKMSRS
jgi:hypothetical protein